MAEILVERMMFRVEFGSVVILLEIDEATTQARTDIERQALKVSICKRVYMYANCCIRLERWSKKCGEFIALEEDRVQVSDLDRVVCESSKNHPHMQPLVNTSLSFSFSLSLSLSLSLSDTHTHTHKQLLLL